MRTYIEPGSYNAQCMRCGLFYKGTDISKEPHTGLYVCPKCYDEENPQTHLKVPVEHTRGSRYIRDTLVFTDTPGFGRVWGYDLSYVFGGPGGWATWVLKETSTAATYSNDYGEPTLTAGQTIVSPVIDTGIRLSRPINFDSISGYDMIYRYGDTTWAQDATEGVGGVWITFDPDSVETATFQFIQVGISA